MELAQDMGCKTQVSIGTKILDVLSGGIGGKIFDTIDKLVPDKDLRETLKGALDMKRLTGDIDLEKVAIEAERDTQLAIEQTHQAALNQSDLSTKRARPDIARSSWRLCWFYTVSTIGSQVLEVFVEAIFDVDMPTVAFDPVIFGTIAGPALWYMGMRGFDKWKGNG